MIARLGLRHPILQGPFGGGISSVALAAAVTDAGGLGAFGVHHLRGDGIRDVAAALRAATSGPFNLNLWVPVGTEADPAAVAAHYARAVARLRPYYDALGVEPPAAEACLPLPVEEQYEAVLDARPAVFSFIFGVPPAAILEACRARGILTLGTATHVAEAEALAAAGVDAIVVSGSEAGGHRASWLGAPEDAPALSALLPQVADRVDLPLVAAGGIADGRGLVAAMALGATAVQVGTAFLACDESGASAPHRAALRAGGVTAQTRVFSGRLARGLRNGMMVELQPDAADMPPYPIQNALTGPIRRAAGAAGDADRLALWAGQNVGLVRYARAAEVVAEMVAQAEAVRGRLAGLSIYSPPATC